MICKPSANGKFFYVFSHAPLYEHCHAFTWSIQLTLSLNICQFEVKLLCVKKKKTKKKILYYPSRHTTSTSVVCLLGISTSFITMANKYWATLVSVKENHFHDPLQQIVCRNWANVGNHCM